MDWNLKSEATRHPVNCVIYILLKKMYRYVYLHILVDNYVGEYERNLHHYVKEASQSFSKI